MKKRLLGSLLTALVALSAMGQVSNTLSPYSQFGLGALADQSQSMGRGMAGLSVALRDSKFVNVQNPASYSAVDSLTMVFDVGVSGQFTNFKEGNRKLNAKTADFDYAVGLFRLFPKIGAAVGVIPYSNVGYSYYNSEFVGSTEGHVNVANTNYYQNTYSGTGGISQAFFGLGWEFAKGVSIGANISYFWGTYEKKVYSALNDTYAKTLSRSYKAEISNWKLDLGAQWSTMVSRQDRLTVGVTAGIGHKLGADAILSTVITDGQTSVSSTTADTLTNALSIPFSFGGGVSLLHRNSLTVGVDYTLQKWGSLDFPQVNETTKHYELKSGVLKDRHKVTVGVDWLPNPNPMSRGFFNHIHYRAGASYATPYYKIGTHDGPKEICVSAGLAIPIVNSWNNRSTLNISAQWVHTSAKDFVTENSFRVNIGLTFNERWFAKWKVD